MVRSFLAALVALTLIGCSTPANRLDMSPVVSELRLRAAVSSVMLRSVSLPTYAAAEDIAQEIAPGVIGAQTGVLWADDPERAVTLAMTRHLDTILSATVGPDPWPFVGLPDVAVEVQVSEMLARSTGSFRFTGQFYIGGDGIDYPNTSKPFSFDVPLATDDLSAIAMAQAKAILLLSESIAREIGR